jgi:Uma2 family endonuclease
MAIAAKRWTIEDLQSLEETGVQYELLRGELIEVPGAKFLHWYLVGRLLRFIGNFVARHKLGAVGNNGAFELRRDPDSLLIPDVAFVSSARMPPGDADWDVYVGAPDAVFEVVSPSDSASDVHDKTMEYLEAGVRVVVVVWPRRQTVSVHRADGESREFTAGDVVELDDVLPGFRLSIAELFDRSTEKA